MNRNRFLFLQHLWMDLRKILSSQRDRESVISKPGKSLNEVTALIKTFERPKELDRLIKSIRRFYPDLLILVADDSKKPQVRDDVPYYVLPYNIGLSAGRNFLVKKVQTKYVVLFDDDHVCTENTKIEKMVEILRNYPIDLVGGDFINEGVERHCFHGTYEIKDSILYQYIGKNKGYQNGYPLYDVIHNFFVAKNDKLKTILWDEKIKFSREHADYFLRCRGELNITRVSRFSVDHFRGENYHAGARGKPYRELFKKKWNISDRVYVRVRPDEELDERFENNLNLDEGAVPINKE